MIEEKDRSSSLATPFTFFVALKCCWSIIRKTARNLGRLVIYVQIGSGFMLLCNLLLKCPIINHTFGQVIISVASNLTHLENLLNGWDHGHKFRIWKNLKTILKLLMFGINSAAMHLKFIKILGIGWSKIGFLSLLMFFFSSQWHLFS